MTRINITLGTAGHIDHGKTSLVKCLTGCETDRLKEEKERGMSIELGFAPCTLANLEVGIVDVPGHENFIKTMVAGATGIDGVIFLVAADDGVMPQTREHLDILTLLGIRHGVVALTKIDMVTPDRAEAAQQEVRQFLHGTFLEHSPICPVSCVTGAGFDMFLGHLTEMIKAIRPKSVDGVFRLPVERAFSVKGFGTVISGIPCAGGAKVGDEVTLLPSGQKSRIKAVQVYGKSAEAVQSGQCAAINVPQINHQTVERGQVLTVGDYFEPQRWFLASMQLLATDSAAIKHGMQIKFHTGTAETPATLYLMQEGAVADGSELLVQIRTDHLITAGPRDRFIVRTLSPVRTIGGGLIVRAMPGRLKSSHPEAAEDARRCAAVVLDDTAFVEYAVQAASGCAAKSKEIAHFTKMLPDAVQTILKALAASGRLRELLPGLYIHPQRLEALERTICDCIQKYHAANPATPGIEPQVLLETLDIEKVILDAVIALLIGRRQLAIRKDRLALAGFAEKVNSTQATLLDRLEAAFKTNLFNPPSVDELTKALRLTLLDLNRNIKILCDQKILFRVEQDMYFHADAIEQAKQRVVTHIKGEGQGRLESVDFKYLIDTSRKYAIPLLDYMDKIGVTRRVGNTRYFKS